jgi:quinol monooxygenase YgiN
MVIITGYLDFPDLDRDEVLDGLAEITRLSRQDAGCVEYWWAEDTGHTARFRFFECWESAQHLAEHRAQPFEDEFMATFVRRCSGADAHVYEVTSRTSAV